MARDYDGREVGHNCSNALFEVTTVQFVFINMHINLLNVGDFSTYKLTVGTCRI